MKSISLKNKIYSGSNNKQSLYDLEVPKNWNNKLVIFIHGYMGFKDWGCWNLVSDFFTEKGYGFLKYNVSHNGCSTTDPTNFVDLEDFAFNTYSKELEDFNAIIELAQDTFEETPTIYIIGHSRGGGIALLQSQNIQVAKICSWAGISTIYKRFPKGAELEAWKENKYRYTKNGRTGQNMPHHYEQYLDYITHKDRLNIESYCRRSKKPTMIIHGADDQSVSIDEGRELANWLDVDLRVIPKTAHTFDSSHPWKTEAIPLALQTVCEQTLLFFNSEFNTEEGEKLSLLSDLIKLAQSDNKIRDNEFHFLHSIARQLGVSTDDFKSLFEKYIEFQPPQLEADRIVQFQRLILLMNVDQDTDSAEIDYIKNIGIRMGLHPSATQEVLRVMNVIKDLKIEGTFHFRKGYYYFRNIDGRILFGGGRNLDIEGETTSEMENTSRIIDALKSILDEVILPGQNYQVEYEWAGIMGVGSDKKPIIKKIKDGVFCGVRLGGMGVAIGSLVGKELADIIKNDAAD